MRDTPPFFAYLRPTGERVEFRFRRAGDTRHTIKSIDGDEKCEVTLEPHEHPLRYAEYWMRADDGTPVPLPDPRDAA